jgi:hypothetical protein
MTDKREKPFRLDMPFGEALGRFVATRPDEVEKAIQLGRPGDMEPKQGELQLVHYNAQECQADFALDPSNETVWATQAQIAAAFGIAENTVTGHLKTIFREGELDENSVARKFRARGKDGKEYNLLHFSLDAILSVGYRVSSKRATAFRQWATQTLKDYIIQGFALDEQRLRDDPQALRDLAARVRALRADEKNIYQGVRDVFAFGSSDYDKDAPAVRSFYAKVQDKFLHAITGKTASEIKLERANHRKPAMGLTDMKGDYPTRVDVGTGKNYLREDELYALHILCEQFLLFVESKAIRGQKMTMVELSTKFDDLLRFQGHAVFPEYKDYLKDKANAHAMREYDAWFERTKGLPKEQKRLV